MRKLAAILLVLTSLTIGIIGVGVATQGRWWGIGLVLVAPFGVWAATRLTPEGGTTGYFDKNI